MRSYTPWQVIGASVQGASHRRAGLPNQDAIGWSSSQVTGDAASTASILAVALADGHGHPLGIRAQRGASLAIDVALGLATRDPAALATRSGAEKFLDDLTTSLPILWMDRVRADLAADPVGDIELDRLVHLNGSAPIRSFQHHPELAYGATAILAVATPDHVILAQLGDGAILTVSKGGAVSYPLKRDPRLVGNQTWSLASPDASTHFRTTVLPAAQQVHTYTKAQSTTLELVVLATDGYVNSYQDDAAFEQVGADVLDMLASHRFETLQAQLPEWLETTSEMGCGDDVTVAFIGHAAAPCTTGGSRPQERVV
ncbi:MAG: protein phosphatase 2C domain-containing protein [Actinobacteria bacterium]|nr:protein phosphatase 2C domain-containing protein [Actinomycetota bacterium]MCL5446659.1 protein phosphatase 2C domain-containing protein [Actinomycetota bacterium]